MSIFRHLLAHEDENPVEWFCPIPGCRASGRAPLPSSAMTDQDTHLRDAHRMAAVRGS